MLVWSVYLFGATKEINSLWRFWCGRHLRSLPTSFFSGCPPGPFFAVSVKGAFFFFFPFLMWSYTKYVRCWKVFGFAILGIENNNEFVAIGGDITDQIISIFRSSADTKSIDLKISRKMTIKSHVNVFSNIISPLEFRASASHTRRKMALSPSIMIRRNGRHLWSIEQSPFAVSFLSSQTESLHFDFEFSARGEISHTQGCIAHNLPY